MCKVERTHWWSLSLTVLSQTLLPLPAFAHPEGVPRVRAQVWPDTCPLLPLSPPSEGGPHIHPLCHTLASCPIRAPATQGNPVATAFPGPRLGRSSPEVLAEGRLCVWQITGLYSLSPIPAKVGRLLPLDLSWPVTTLPRELVRVMPSRPQQGGQPCRGPPCPELPCGSIATLPQGPHGDTPGCGGMATQLTQTMQPSGSTHPGWERSHVGPDKHQLNIHKQPSRHVSLGAQELPQQGAPNSLATKPWELNTGSWGKPLPFGIARQVATGNRISLPL